MKGHDVNRRPWAAFFYRDYRFLWGTLMLGSMAVWMRILGTAQWLLDETGSAYWVGFIGVVQLLVQTPMTLWAGTLADRWDRKRLMTFSHGVAGMTLVALGAASAANLLQPMMMYVGIAMLAGAQTLAGPARSALLPIIVPKKNLMSAVSTDTAFSNAAAILGPLLFAAVALSTDLTTVFLLSGLLASIAGCLPLFISAKGQVESEGNESKATQVQQTMNGFRYVSKHPILPGLFLLDAGITTASFYREILPVLAFGLFAGGAGVTGLLGTANSLGAIAGAFFALALVGFRAKGLLVLYASFAYGFILLGFGLANYLWLGVLMIALLGAADAVTVAVRQTTIMLTTPDDMRGRAFAIMYLAAQTANNIGTIWVGFWAGTIGASNTMVLGGFISIAATALIGVLWRPITDFRSDD